MVVVSLVTMLGMVAGRTAWAQPPLKEGNTVVVTPSDRVELHVNEAPLATVLRLLATQGRRNIVASPQASGTVTADLFDVKFHEALKSILLANDCDFVERGNFIYVYTLKELDEQEVATSRQVPVARLFRLSYVSAEDLLPMIEPLLSDEGTIVGTREKKVGLATSAEEAGGASLAGMDALLICDYPSRLLQIESVIGELDVRPQQVLIEATILRAQLNENNALGIDFNIVGGVDFQVLASQSPAVTDVMPGNVPNSAFPNSNYTVRTDFNDAVPNGGLTFGLIKDHVAVFLRALEQVNDTTVVANPKVLALNKQRGEVIVGRRDGYLTTTVTETTAVQTVDFLETGTKLVFRPFIGNDGFVRMEIHPEDSSGGLNEAQLPFKRTTEVTTNILVRDGHTILIAGLFRESTNTIRGQLPILGNVPVAGALFRTTTDETSREEVIILLTVHVVEPEKYADAGAGAAEDVERVRIGGRRGVQSFGRDRLALAHYHWAREHLAAGQLDKSLWDARMSLHISPTYQPAARLKEELIGSHACDKRIGSIRNFINTRLIDGGIVTRSGPPSEDESP